MMAVPYVAWLTKRLSSVSPFLLLAMLSTIVTATNAAPVLFQEAAYQSPVRAEPDDLLLLAGFGFAATDAVVYQLIEDSTTVKKPPQSLPTESTAYIGIAPIVSTLNVPNSLTIRLPEMMRPDQTYAFWIRTVSGGWSNAVQINDARPLWISPAYVYSTGSVASLPRYLKVIGRNLQPAVGQVTRIKLAGTQTFVLTAESNLQSPILDQFTARILLPAPLPTGSYRVSVSRDGLSWVPLAGQSLQVRVDPAAPSEYRIDNPAFGNCHADDGQDDAPCLQSAIAAAATSGGTIVLGKGTWDLIDAKSIGIAPGEGLRLPPKVSVRGLGAALTTLIRHPQWNADAAHPAFTLEGNNEIRGLKFHDSQLYTAKFQAAPLLQLGKPYERLANSKAGHAVANVVITENVFDKPSIAITDAGLPIKHLFITYNEFGAFHAAIRLAGNLFNMTDEFRIDDSVIAFNKFYPGSWLDQPNRQGTVASELGAGRRVDFSDNQADGAATDYLNSPTDAHGWRAGFFWHLNGNQELLLISANMASCTGDKIGDGEAISHDNNGNTFAFDTPKQAVKITSDSVTVSGPLLAKQNNRDVPVASYYVGHWIQIGAGPGLGQVRKITSYAIDARTQEVTFNIAPAWDVTPVPDETRISIGREFWQVYTVANTIDHRTPLCMKSNRSDPKGGGISVWAQTADSVVAGNRQYDSDGILFHNQFTAQDPNCKDCYRGTHFVNFLEIRDNFIDGEYDWDTDCSTSGIAGSLAAAPGMPPLTVTYGLSISHNTINHADAWHSGAIAMTPSWYAGPEPHRWPLVDSSLIHHNSITGLWSRRARSCRNQAPPQRTAISLGNSSLVWRAVLYANDCGKVPLSNNLSGAQQITRLCKTGMLDSCECKQ